MKVLRNGIEISDTDIASLQHDLLNIEDWINGAIAGKIHSCKTRLLSEWTTRLMSDPSVDTIPANEIDLIKVITSHPEYKNRQAREAELLESPT